MQHEPRARQLPELLNSSAVSRIERFRSEFTLSMYFRRGPVWEAISAFREAWSVRPIVAAPMLTAEATAMPIIYPAEMTSEPPPSPFQALDPDDAAGLLMVPAALFARSGVPPDDEEGGAFHAAWYRDLKRLHDLLVPDDCRSQAPMPETSWVTFLSIAVAYDPPADQLLEYASSTVLMDLPPTLRPEDDSPDLGTAKHGMIHAPVLVVPDNRALEHAWMAFYEDVFSRLAQILDEHHGLDLKRMRSDLAINEPEIFSKHHERLAAIPRRFAIAIDEHTSPNDVQNALKLIRETNPPATNREGRRPRNPLLCVQCAIWHDDFGWSHKQLAKRFNWTMQHPPGQKPRCETARQHINEGRRIIQENSTS